MAIDDKDLLNLPDAPDFISTPPEYTMWEMAALCEKELPVWNKKRFEKPEPEFIGKAFKLLLD